MMTRQQATHSPPRKTKAAMASCPVHVVVVNPNSRTARHSDVEADCLVLGIFSKYHEAQRFAKLQNREYGDKKYCCVAEDPEDWEVKPSKRSFAKWAAAQFRSMGELAPADWESRFEADDDEDEDDSEDEKSAEDTKEERLSCLLNTQLADELERDDVESKGDHCELVWAEVLKRGLLTQERAAVVDKTLKRLKQGDADEWRHLLQIEDEVKTLLRN